MLQTVGNLGEAVGFYERAGFTAAFRFDESGITLLKVAETPRISRSRR
ncbi:hypothetical protein Stsp02_06140 [Streptomyces sp. NBRC 14336]|nr:hypothetical protein Stsp02_06140 [Streptomyces sp. NBRC 14336]SBT91946.1 hypothetical protein GA0115233_103755 [Streptomyces sp. DI166]